MSRNKNMAVILLPHACALPIILRGHADDISAYGRSPRVWNADMNSKSLKMIVFSEIVSVAEDPVFDLPRLPATIILMMQSQY